MLKVRGWNVQAAMWWCASGYVVGGLQHFSVSPSPLGTNLGFELGCTGLGLGLWGIGTKGLGPGLYNWSSSIVLSADLRPFYLLFKIK